MTKTKLLSTRISPKLDAKLDSLAKRGGRSKSWYVNYILEDRIDFEARTLEMIKEGIEAARRGDVVDHATVVAAFKERVRTRARKAKKNKAA